MSIILFIIGAILLLSLIVWLVKNVLPVVFVGFVATVKFIWKYVLLGPSVYLSKAISFVFKYLRLRLLVVPVIGFIVFSLYYLLEPATLGYSITETSDSLSIVIAFLAFIYYLYCFWCRLCQFRYRKIIDFKTMDTKKIESLLTSIFLYLEAELFLFFLPDEINFTLFVGFAFLSFFYLCFNLIKACSESVTKSKFRKKITTNAYFNFDGICKQRNIKDKNKVLCEIELKKLVFNKKFVNLYLGNADYYINSKLYSELKTNIENTLQTENRIEKQSLLDEISKELDLEEPLLEDFMRITFEDTNIYEFDEGEFYISDTHKEEIVQCSCCGKAILVTNTDIFSGEWFCSDTCRETEELCVKIIKMPKYVEAKKSAEQVGNAAAIGAAAWGTGQYWIQQAKIVSASQGHGFAAEQANTLIDKLAFKNAMIVGDDNAVNGADRLVDGQLIQSKYCYSAEKSVSEAFHQKINGEVQKVSYRYMNSQTGKPMQLEVPRDQYENAVKEMEKRISNGEVPGVSDPNDAKKIIRKGNITYKQAQQITKFGTVESLAYDAVHGIVIAGSAAGVSFVISTAITYWRTKDIDLAIKVSAVQGAKAGGKAFAVYMVGAQMQRIPAVTQFLDKAIKINFTNSESGKYIAQQLAGKSSTGKPITGKQLNKRANAAVKGAVVTACAAIAVQSTIEIVKMARGRISGMQCVKNITVATAGIAAGTAGSLIGGVLLSPIPVVGPVIGSVLGGAVFGKLASAGTKKVLDHFIKDDSVKMLGLITKLVEYIAIEFSLTETEMDILSKELDAYISETSKLFEDIYQSKNRRSKIISFLKPMVVNIVRHRDEIEFEVFDEENIVGSICA